MSANHLCSIPSGGSETPSPSACGSGARAVTDRAFAAANLSRRVTIEIPDIATGADHVRHGFGIALLPRFAVADDHGVRLTVTGADLNWTPSLATPVGRPVGPPAVR
ncbi:LysR substrate-binding domain-containing protein [Micromonospora sp. NPDC050276]|uniref:LysR substrate-binding domain-containing protein n=1 Tax=Micromonospora sp. NPDC050276 TaxID=3364278 RepID=UPI00379638A4